MSSLAKKFNLVFVVDPDEPNSIIMEPIQYYVGSGEIRDWNGKLSYDKGFTVEPAQNFVESEITFNDSEDEDGGNSEFQRLYSKRYGEKKVYSRTEFRSRSKKIETIFSPEVLRRWDVPNTPLPNGDISLPLGINYSESSSDRDDGQVDWTYEGLKSKPKLFYYVDNVSPFVDSYGEFITEPQGGVNTVTVKISEDGTTNQFLGSGTKIPVISHTSPIGNPDQNKITNDTASVLFGSENALNIGVEAYSSFTKFDAYNRYYENYINNLFGKDTRFIKGKFQLNLDDILNIQPNDLIKIKEQYFTYNKISGYDLTSSQLTEVELIQYNNILQTYPVRYFQYYYGDNQTVIYKFSTDMTDPNFSESNWGRSIRYDYFVGTLGGDAVSVTTGVRDNSQESGDPIVLVPQIWYEVDKDTYESSGIDRQYDPLYVYTTTYVAPIIDKDLSNFFYPIIAAQYSGTNYNRWLNVYTSLTDFNSKSTSYGFTSGSSTTHTTIPTATPTATPLPSPTPTAQEDWGDGSFILTYDEFEYPSESGGSRIMISVNNDERFHRHEDITDGYATYLNDGDVIKIEIHKNTEDPVTFNYDMIVREFTNDNQDGDNGIKEINATPESVVETSSLITIIYVVSLTNENCTFEYRFNANNIPTATPTATPFPTPTPTECWKCSDDAGFPCVDEDPGSLVFVNDGIDDRLVILNGWQNYPFGPQQRGTTILQANGCCGDSYYYDWTGYYGPLTWYNDGTFPGYKVENTSNPSWTSQYTHRQVNPNVIGGESGQPFGSTVLAGGSIMIYGNFHYYGPLITDVPNLVNNCDSVVKVQSNGLTDTSFTGKTFGFYDASQPGYVDALVERVEELSDGSLIFVGQFSTYDGVQVGGLLKTDSQGNLDYTFNNNIGTAFGASPGQQTVSDIAIDSNDNIALGGQFQFFNGNTSIKYLLLLDKDGNNLTCNITPAPTATPTMTPFPTATPEGTPYPTPIPTGTATPLPTATLPPQDPDGYMTDMSWCDGEYIAQNAIQSVGPYIHMNTPFISDQTTCNPEWTTLSNCIDVGNFITYPTIQTEGWYGLTHIPDSYVNIDPFVIFYILTTGEIVSTKQCQNGQVVGWPSDQPPFDDPDVTPTPVPGCTNVPPSPSPTPSPTQP